MTLEMINSWKSFDGEQRVYKHMSTSTKTEMQFSVFLPPVALTGKKVPVLFYLSGLTCTWENATGKAGFQRVASELGMMVVCPDTSPRGEGVADVDAWDFGQGASFYIDAENEPYEKHFQMETYVAKELSALVFTNLPADEERQAITGHSMGGHGALTLALKDPKRFASVSAFSPIVHPTMVPWGQKAFAGYLKNKADGKGHDAVELLKSGVKLAALKADFGGADNFLEEQLRPQDLTEVCKEQGQPLELNIHAGYDHSYYFVSSFIDEHLRWHAQYLGC